MRRCHSRKSPREQAKTRIASSYILEIIPEDSSTLTRTFTSHPTNSAFSNSLKAIILSFTRRNMVSRKPEPVIECSVPSDDPISLKIGQRTAIMPFIGSDTLLEELRDKSCVRFTVDSTRCSSINVVLAVESAVDLMWEGQWQSLQRLTPSDQALEALR